VKITAQMLMLMSLCVACFATQPTSLIVSPVSVEHKVTLSQALGQIGVRVQGGYVLFGIDIPRVPEPEVDLKIVDPTSLGTALGHIVGQLEGYGFRTISDHVIEVYSIREFLDPADVLNLHVGHFVVANRPAGDIFSKPASFIPELRNHILQGKAVQACGSIGPGLSSAGPGITLELHEATLREVLDAVAESDAVLLAHIYTHTSPVGWVHRVRIDKKGNFVDAWSVLSTVPHGWEHNIPHAH